jgi:DNA-binding NarL/FixJ family response regulator
MPPKFWIELSRLTITFLRLMASAPLERQTETIRDSAPKSAALIHRTLSAREREIVQLVAEGKSCKEVAVTLGISVKTAETHRSNIMRKLEMHSVSELARYAVKNHMIEP